MIFHPLVTVFFLNKHHLHRGPPRTKPGSGQLVDLGPLFDTDTKTVQLGEVREYYAVAWFFCFGICFEWACQDF